MSQTQRQRPVSHHDLTSAPLSDLQAPTSGKQFLEKTAAMNSYLKQKRTGKICRCGDPNCTIGPFVTLA